MPLEPRLPDRSARSTSGRPSAQRQFTDRDDLISGFRLALAAKSPTENRVLVYYGLGGIGKTRLREALSDTVRGDNTAVSAEIDFLDQGLRQPENALFALRQQFQKRHGCRFPTFDIAYATYWKMTRPGTLGMAETSALFEAGSLAGEVLSSAGVPFVGIATVALKKGYQPLRDWWYRRGREDLHELDTLAPREILERLPLYLAEDLKDDLADGSKRAVVFLDSHEALMGDLRLVELRLTRDEWVRDLVDQLPQVLWVICGREKLQWPRVNPDWAGVMEQHLVGPLSDLDAGSFLEGAGVEDAVLRDLMVREAGGVPLILDLLLDTLEGIEKREGRKALPADFETPSQTTEDKACERFLKYLGPSEQDALQVLAVPHSFHPELFDELRAPFQIGLTPDQFEELCRLSFIEEDGHGAFRMNRVIRAFLGRRLRTHQAERDRKIQEFLLEYYSQPLTDLDPLAIGKAQEQAFQEAFYHAANTKTPEDLWSWLCDFAEPFEEAARWGLVAPAVEETLALLGGSLDPTDPTLVEGYLHLADTYDELGRFDAALALVRGLVTRLDAAQVEEADDEGPDLMAEVLGQYGLLLLKGAKYEEAEAVFNRVLEIAAEANWADDETCDTLTALATLYQETDRPAEAEAALLRCVEIREEGEEESPLELAVALRDVALFYASQDRVDEALPLVQRSLDILEETVHEDHPEIAETLDYQALLLCSLERYEEALPLYERSLAIREANFGESHPEMAFSLDNLGTLYCDLGRYPEAEEVFLRSLEIRTALLGQDHPEVALAESNLGHMYADMGREDEALAHMEHALAIRTLIYGPQHPDVAKTLDDLCSLCEQLGRPEQARKLRDRFKVEAVDPI